ncbi:MAG: hypothetical protein JWM68_1956 [Verrucomicrobiales bacterium]|nr:hypothetical protein [Verrucomicrobiales bacterium]
MSNSRRQIAPILLLLAILGLSFTQFARAQTWIQWSSSVGGNNHYYALTPAATNWIDAERLAKSWGGTLATITSSNEQNFVDTTFLTGAFEHMPVWIGLLDPVAKGTALETFRQAKELIGTQSEAHTFEWVTGEPVSYRNWKAGEPNNSAPGEYYVSINWEYSKNPISGFKGEWNDVPLEGTKGYSGNTDGPYFGLMERTMDRDRPVATTSFHWELLLLAALILVIVVYISRKRRSAQKRP